MHVLTSSHLQSGVVQSGHNFWHSVLVGSDCADAMARRPARTMAVNVMLVLVRVSVSEVPVVTGATFMDPDS